MNSIAVSVSAAAISTLAWSCVNPAVLARVDSPDAGEASMADARSESGGPPSDGDHEHDAGESPLHVDGTLVAENLSPNAANASSFESRVVLHITRGGLPVDGAVVTLTGPTASTVLAYSGGTFVGSLRAYDSSWSLDVVDANVTVLHAMLAGPAIHVFTSPLDGDASRAGTPLSVTWAPSGAQSATIETAHVAETTIVDNGNWLIPSSALVGESGQLVDDRIRLRRRSVVTVPGAADDSNVVFEIRNEVGFAIDGR